MNIRMNRIFACTSLVLAFAAAAPLASANLLVDPGYESNPLTSYVNVLTDFTTYQGQWGVENATIVAAENGVTPAGGVQMLRMDDDGLVATQGFQTTDVNSYAGVIDGGSAMVGLSGLFNVDANVPAAIGGVTIFFFSAANYGSQIGSAVTGNISLDNLPATWEMAQVNVAVPVGTRWLMTQVAYSNASLIGNDGVIHPGYVDSTDLRLIPEPSSVGLLALGALGLLRRR